MARRLVACGVAAVFLALLGGGVVDAVFPIAPDDMKPGCHTDYYLRVIPVGMYCSD